MVRLLDHIFADLNQIKRDRNLVIAHLVYLNEILNQGLPQGEKTKYSALKVQLEARLQELDSGEAK